jgi:hypothetical protein
MGPCLWPMLSPCLGAYGPFSFPLWDHDGPIMGPILGPYSVHVGTILGSSWIQYGPILEPIARYHQGFSFMQTNDKPPYIYIYICIYIYIYVYAHKFHPSTTPIKNAWVTLKKTRLKKKRCCAFRWANGRSQMLPYNGPHMGPEWDPNWTPMEPNIDPPKWANGLLGPFWPYGGPKLGAQAWAHHGPRGGPKLGPIMGPCTSQAWVHFKVDVRTLYRHTLLA